MMTNEQALEHSMKPKLQVSGSSSKIKINLSHSIYNKLSNIDSIFQINLEDDL